MPLLGPRYSFYGIGPFTFPARYFDGVGSELHSGLIVNWQRRLQEVT